MNGIDNELIKYCLSRIDKPLIYAGGCSSEKEIVKFKKRYKNVALSFASHFYKKIFKLVNDILR